MSIAIVTGATGLVGVHAVEEFNAQGFDVVGIDNDMRRRLFPGVGSAEPTRERLETTLTGYRHYDQDIRDESALNALFQLHGEDIALIIHAAAQPSHDWAAQEPLVDFSINATGTLLLLEATRKHCPDAAFIFCSTNKVYGDGPNRLPLVEMETRWEIDDPHPYSLRGISEDMSIDATKHSLFGVSKTAADLLVQEYGLYFGMKTVVFRAGCITGAAHRGAAQHGFLAYLARCVGTDGAYEVIGHKGKQVRDNLHASDLVQAFVEFWRSPRSGEIYNIGGGRSQSCSVLEAISLFEDGFNSKLRRRYVPQARAGDHVWWITDTAKFGAHYPRWSVRRSLGDIIGEFVAEHSQR